MTYVPPDIRIAPGLSRSAHRRPDEPRLVHPELAAAMMRAQHARGLDAGRPRHGEDTVVEREGAFPAGRYGTVFPAPDWCAGHAHEAAYRWEAAALLAERQGLPAMPAFAGRKVDHAVGGGLLPLEAFSFAAFMAVCLQRAPGAQTSGHDLRAACKGFCAQAGMETPDDSTWGHALAAAGFVRVRGGKAHGRRRFYKHVRLTVEGEVMALVGGEGVNGEMVNGEWKGERDGE